MHLSSQGAEHNQNIMCLQAAHQGGEDEVSLSTMGRAYTIDYNTMQQVNEDTGTARPVQRKAQSLTSQPAQKSGKFPFVNSFACDKHLLFYPPRFRQNEKRNLFIHIFCSTGSVLFRNIGLFYNVKNN